MEEDSKSWFHETQVIQGDTDTKYQNICELQNDIDFQNVKVEVMDEGHYNEMSDQAQQKFSVKVEVEEFEDQHTTFFPVIENTPSAIEFISNSTHKSQPDDSEISPKYESIKLHLFDGNVEDVCLEADSIASESNNLADKLLALEVKNSCGILAKQKEDVTLLETKFNHVVFVWRMWCTSMKCSEEPLFYKCYLCEKSWWHLGPFLEHAKGHCLEEYSLFLETSRLYECNIVLGNEKAFEQSIYTEGDCWRCNRPFSFHDAVSVKSPLYKCGYCEKSFYKCKVLTIHEAVCVNNPKDKMKINCDICEIKFEFQRDFAKHLHTSHTVRSDLLVLSKYLVCLFCNEKYYNYHKCMNKIVKFNCGKCHRHFLARVMFDGHKSFSESGTSCKICNTQIESRCMDVDHYLTHTDNFKMVQKCCMCTDVFLFWDDHAMTIHQLLWHTQFDSKKLSFDKVVIPTKCLEDLKKFEPGPKAYSRHMLEMQTIREETDKNTPICVIKDSPISVEENVPMMRITKNKSINTKNTLTKPLTKNKPVRILKNSLQSKNTPTPINITKNMFINIDKKSPFHIVKEGSVYVIKDGSKSTIKNLPKNEPAKVNNDESINLSAGGSKSLLRNGTVSVNKDGPSKVANDGLKSVLENVAKDGSIDLNKNKPTSLVKDGPIGVLKDGPIGVLKDSPISVLKDESVSVSIDEAIITTSNKSANESTDEADSRSSETSSCISKDVPINEIKIKEEIEDEYEVEKYVFIEDYDLVPEIFTISKDGISMKTEIKNEPIDYSDDGMCDNNGEDSRLIIDVKQGEENDGYELYPEANIESSSNRISPRKPRCKRPKIYTCNRCGFRAIHRFYREHIATECLRVPRGKNKKKKVKFDQEHTENIYKCSKCNDVSHTVNGYLNHFSKHGYDYMCCPVCLKDFSDEIGTKLVSHFNTHMKRSFLRVKEIKPDTVSIPSQTWLECKSCKETVDFEELFSHWESHLEIKDFDPSQREQRKTLREYRMNKVNPEQIDKSDFNIYEIIRLLLIPSTDFKLLACTICTREFNRKNDVKRHYIEHLLTDAFKKKCETGGKLRCIICMEGFKKAEEYKRHMREHANLPIYRCGLCNKSFSDSSNFVKHKKVHNMHVFTCDLCRRKYQSKESLQKHMKMHSVTKPVSCTMCQKKCYTSAELRKHVRSAHEKYKIRFKCRMCDESFPALKQKWDHLWLVHKERPHKADCPICKKSFRKYHDVKVHVREEHNQSLVRKEVMFMEPLKKKRQNVEEYVKNNVSLELNFIEQLNACEED